MFQKPLGDGACLALLELSNAQEMYTLIHGNSAHLRQWLPWVSTTTSPGASELWIKEALKRYAANRELHAGIWVEDHLAGVIGCDFMWQNRAAVIGYWLGAEYQGRGLMTKACKAMLQHCFEGLGINRAEIRCAVGNQRSRAIPQRLGFTQEGVLREVEWLHDHYVDHVVYGLLAREWIQDKCPDTNVQ